ncbi:hypothetical protein PspLS_03523 [Pyricularia sp. CBS 133598]|nr:hypothetical protein PspLS_03523 [Pyricularia sp. CBS 133598]
MPSDENHSAAMYSKLRPRNPSSHNAVAGWYDNPIKIDDEEMSPDKINDEDEHLNLLPVLPVADTDESSSDMFSTAASSPRRDFEATNSENADDASSLRGSSEPPTSSPPGFEATTIREAETLDMDSSSKAHENKAKRPLENTDSEQQDKKQKQNEPFHPSHSEEMIQRRLHEDLEAQRYYRMKAESRVRYLEKELEKLQDALETAQAKTAYWHDEADGLDEALLEAKEEQHKARKECTSAKQQRTRVENKLSMLEKQYDELEAQLVESKEDADTERTALSKEKEARALVEKDMEVHIKALRDEKQQREEAEQEAIEFKKYWKKTARKLDRSTKAKPVPHQVSDQYLLGELGKLKYIISNFAVTHFDGEPLPYHKPALDLMEELNKLTSADHGALAYLQSATHCPSIVQAYIWTQLRDKVFGCFLWAERISEQLCDLVEGMSSYGQDYLRSPDKNFLFHSWRAKTSSLMVDMTAAFHKEHKNMREETIRIAGMLRDFLTPLRRPQMKGAFAQELQAIVDQAAALDMEMSRQLAHLQWLYPDCQSGPCPFDEETMVLDRGDDHSTRADKVLLVVAPGLQKCGRWTGEDFDQENVLLKADVTCDPAPLWKGISHH